MNTPRWYALRTRSRAEKVVCEQIRKHGIESFVPLRTRISQWKDRRKRIDVPAFPGYCFARFSLDQTLLVLQSREVIEIMGKAEGQPVPIPDSEIAAVRQVITSGRPFDVHPRLYEGMGVQVIRGPLIGLHGRLVESCGGYRLIMTVTLIGQTIAVHIDAADVASVLISFGSPALLGITPL